jgi:hypothetical protein
MICHGHVHHPNLGPNEVKSPVHWWKCVHHSTERLVEGRFVSVVSCKELNIYIRPFKVMGLLEIHGNNKGPLLEGGNHCLPNVVVGQDGRLGEVGEGICQISCGLSHFFTAHNLPYLGL